MRFFYAFVIVLCILDVYAIVNGIYDDDEDRNISKEEELSHFFGYVLILIPVIYCLLDCFAKLSR